MAASSTFWLRITVLFYAFGLIQSMLVILGRKVNYYGFALGMFRVGVVLHGVAIVELARSQGALPVENFYGTLNLCAFLVALVFLLVDWKYRFASTSVALFPLVFLMTLVAQMERPVSAWSNDHMRDAWLVIHIV